MDIIYTSFEQEKREEAKERIIGWPTWKTFRTDDSIQEFLKDFNTLPFVYTNAPSCAGTYSEHPHLSFGLDEHPFSFLRNTNNRLLWQFVLNYLHPDAPKLLNDLFQKISTGEFLKQYDGELNPDHERTYQRNHPLPTLTREQLEIQEEFYVPELSQNMFSKALPLDVASKYYQDRHLETCVLLEHSILIHGYDKNKEVIGVRSRGLERRGWSDIKRGYQGAFQISIGVGVPLFYIHEGKLCRRNITTAEFDKERKAQIAGLHEIVLLYYRKK